MFYTNQESGETFYVTDTHANRLRKNGERYSAVYKSPGPAGIETVDRADSLEELDLEEVDGISIEEELEGEKARAPT